MGEHVTVRGLQALERKAPPDQRQEIADAAMPGLYLVRQPSGAMSWAVRYRFAGRPRKMTLGSYPALGLAEARREAAKAIRTVEEGTDPGAEKVAQKAAQRAAAPAPDRDLLENVVEEYMRRAVAPKLRSAEQVQRIFEKHVLPHWSGRKIQSITRRDVIELTDAIVDRGEPSAANRVFATVRPLFNWAVSRSIIEVSPCTGLSMPAAENKRDRVLTDEEIRLVWQAAGGMGPVFGNLFRLLLLTGQRREEVSAMRWSEIDGTEWTIPAERAKNARPNLVPLSAESLQCLESVPRIGGGDFVLTTNGRAPVSGFSKAKVRLDALMAEAAGGREPAPWRIHDLRRSVATGMARLRIPPHIIESVLNHKSGQISGVAGVYNRYEYQEEKQAALAAWGRYVAELVGDRSAGNVVEIGRR